VPFLQLLPPWTRRFRGRCCFTFDALIRLLVRDRVPCAQAGDDDANDVGSSGTMDGATFPYPIPRYRTRIVESSLALVEVHDDPGVSKSYLAHESR
jgi:hypothetical protein